MRIKLYIVTYNNSNDLNNNLNSLFASDANRFSVDINIINNHSNFSLDHKFHHIKVIHNAARPDFSTGHLARNWNQAIIHGFKDLNNPDCDILIHCQDDSFFDPNWCQKLLELHQRFSFIQMGVGDNFCSYTAEAVKHIGLWDERFCGLGYQEGDYFLRCLIYNRDKSCINDHQHGRLHNSVNYSLCGRPAPPHIFSQDHLKSMKFHPINEKVFMAKWVNILSNYWAPDLCNRLPNKSAIPNFIFYPYFEKDVYDLAGKNYII